jgi:hypothetical protein
LADSIPIGNAEPQIGWNASSSQGVVAAGSAEAVAELKKQAVDNK